MNSVNDTSANYPFEERYYILNKRALCFVGLWPYQSFRERCVRIFCTISLNISILIPLILKFASSRREVNVMIEMFAPLVTNFGVIIKTLNLIRYSKELRILLDSTRENWECVRRHIPELKILQEYGEKGRTATSLYMTMCIGFIMLYITMPMITVVQDWIMPLNESRPHIVLIPTDYKVDPDEYFYPIYLHGSVAILVCMNVYIANDSLYMAIAQHACGMIEILRYRLENIAEEGETSHAMVSSNYREDVYYRPIVLCIETHKRIVEYITLLESTCEWLLVAAVGLTMISISSTGAQTVSADIPTGNVIRFAIFVIAQVSHLFCNTLPGHWIMNSSSLIRDSAYNCRWYMISPKSRQLLLALIRRCAEPCIITAGKIYVMSMENFSCVLKMSASYFTILTSIQ